jgi:hypothetical protein
MKTPEAEPQGAETRAANAENPEELTPEQMDHAAHWLQQMAVEAEEKRLTEKHPEPTELERTQVELNELFEAWLTPEKLEALHALTTEAEAMESPLRAEAKLALAEIKKRMDPTTKEKYNLLSRAVGIINGGKVDHTR